MEIPATLTHPVSSPSTGFPVPEPELISQLEQKEELWVLDLWGAKEPEVLRSHQKGKKTQILPSSHGKCDTASWDPLATRKAGQVNLQPPPRKEEDHRAKRNAPWAKEVAWGLIPETGLSCKESEPPAPPAKGSSHRSGRVAYKDQTGSMALGFLHRFLSWILFNPIRGCSRKRHFFAPNPEPVVDQNFSVGGAEDPYLEPVSRSQAPGIVSSCPQDTGSCPAQGPLLSILQKHHLKGSGTKEERLFQGAKQRKMESPFHFP
ncbi:uncharacterized protein LOC128563450 [Nycticebus coucang]|uniref:uncharacterized protein LOC128563450 n=1 Tax=Nycticebus coucang TaxID=9470 RepID=UPI00234E2DD0|nr:uncharacterized protein LOC128563450 [Nycticebus coucang]